MSLAKQLRGMWCRFQGNYVPRLRPKLALFLKTISVFLAVLELVCSESFIRSVPQKDDRPLADRVNLARAFLAKAMWDFPTPRAQIERLEVNRRLRNQCGLIFAREIPSESIFFSRAFAEFSENDLAGRFHEALIKETLGQGIVGHVSRDSTAIPAREKPTPKGESD